jgi:hypothetical protein
MLEFLCKVRKACKQRNPDATFGFEAPCEIWIQEVDLHMHRPYLIRPFGQFAVPLFDYLYHDYALTYGGDFRLGLAHPEVELIKHARVLTYGLQNMVGIGHYEWDYEVNPNYPALTLMRSIVQAQRTYAQDYLVFGHMLKPTKLDVNRVIVDIFSSSSMGGSPPDVGELEVPKVMHGVWRSPNGKIGYIMANWTGEAEDVTLKLVEPGGQIHIVTEGKIHRVSTHEANSGKVTVTIEPRNVVLVEQEKDNAVGYVAGANRTGKPP